MFNIHSLIMHNFRSYKGIHKFEFPTEAGLYFFGGVNLVDRIGGNGAGKSTFLDAITWCLYGKTSRGLKGGEVITDWGNTTTQVTLDLTVGERATIKRSQKPNNLYLNEKPVDQEELQKYIRLNFDAFLHSVLNAQFGESFFSLAPATKLSLFSDINNLDFWIEKSDEATRQSKDIELEIDGLKIEENGILNQINVVDTDLKNLRSIEAEYEKNKNIKIRNINKDISDLEKKKETSYKLSIFTDAKVVDKQKVLKALSSNIDNLEKARNNWIDHLQHRRHIRDNLLAEAAVFKKDYEKFLNLKDLGICPNCRQDMDKTHLMNERYASKENMEAKIESAEKFKLTINEALKKILNIKIEIESEIAKYNHNKDSIDELLEKYNKLQGTTKELHSKELALIAEKQILIHDKNPYSFLRREKAKKIGELRNNLEVVSVRKKKLLSKNEAISFWSKGFKRLRLFIIEKAFSSLEIEISNCLACLGLQDWQVTFDIERENKSGGITKGFTVFVKSPNNTSPVRWENWSGGETQRLQLAGDVGLSNLIMTQAGLVNTLEFYDEPSTHLSHEGMLDLANMLHERALAEDKCIWIIDHTALINFGKLKGIITVTKDENGSNITYEGK